MDPSLVGSYILYDTAAQIWSAIKQTYSQSKNYAEIFAIHQKLLALKQGELTVVAYINLSHQNGRSWTFMIRLQLPLQLTISALKPEQIGKGCISFWMD